MEELKNNSQPQKWDFDNEIERLKAFGLTRDPTLGMNTGGYINAHTSSLNQLGVQSSPQNKFG